MAKFANDEAAIAGTACQPGRSQWSAIGNIMVPSVVLLLLLKFVVMVNLHLATIAVVNAAWACNELLVTLVFLQNKSQRTVAAGLTLLQGRYVGKQPLVLTVTVLSILPVALFYLPTQRSFVPGLKAGWEE